MLIYFIATSFVAKFPGALTSGFLFNVILCEKLKSFFFSLFVFSFVCLFFPINQGGFRREFGLELLNADSFHEFLTVFL